jgi:TorA maturation chaperone TorD
MEAARVDNVSGRDSGLQQAIEAAGGIGALARGLGISQPSVSNWTKVPADRVIAVETLTGIPRADLRPDLYETPADVDPLDLLRSQQYGLLAHLLGKAPTSDILSKLVTLKGDMTPLGLAHIGLAEAARRTDEKAAGAEFFRLFIGVGRGELLPYASWYMTGFLNERPLARVREDLGKLGIERADHLKEPEDHVAILFDVMAGLCSGRIAAEPGFDRAFFERHLQPWAARFFADLELAEGAGFYRSVAAVGRLFIDIETEAFALAA